MPKSRPSDANPDLIGEKPKTKARRKPAARPRKRKEEPSAVYVEPVAQESARPQARFVSAQVAPKRRPSAAVLVLQLVLCLAVGIGAYFGWQQLMDVRRETSSKAVSLKHEVSGELSQMQKRFDDLLKEWEKQEKEGERNNLVPYRNEALAVSFQYPASLGQPIEEAGKITFSANADIWVMVTPLAATSRLVCDNPLQIGPDGYCDGNERVWAEYGEDGKLERIMMSVWLLEQGDKAVEAFVDLGTPPVSGRDVFAPVDESAQEASLEGYYRAILKKESLPPIVAETLLQFGLLVSSV